MFGEKIIRKVPGQSFVNPKEKQGYIDDLSTKTRPELLDLLNRQTTLLENKGFIANLPDKGEKIKALKQRLEEALTRLDKVDQTCGLFSNLSLTSRGGISEEIEWTGKYSGSQHSDEDSETDDIENDETDPLKILVSQGNVGTFKKKNHRLVNKVEDRGKTDIMELKSALSDVDEDIKKGKEKRQEVENQTETSLMAAAASHTTSDPVGDTYANALCSKIDHVPKSKREPFRPYCTNKSGLHPGLHIPKHLGPHWEVTAATPPPPVHGATKQVSLQESLELQRTQAEKLKEIQAKHAAERLSAGSALKIGSAIPAHSGSSGYRNVPPEYDSGGSSDEGNLEMSDGEEEDEKRDTIVYTYTE